MQVLKESVREAIIESAILEFYNKDYQSANMRDIAKNANITVGNIYRYYPNKQSLFNAILIPAQQAIDLLADFDKNTNLKKIHSKEELDKTNWEFEVYVPEEWPHSLLTPPQRADQILDTIALLTGYYKPLARKRKVKVKINLI